MMSAPGERRVERLDVLLVERGLAGTRAKARALVLAGKVSSGGVRLDKAGLRLGVDTPLEVREGDRFVGRGGYKLEGALRSLQVDPRGADALDVGASTGGFTQALLAAGAARVIALDVGHGQLDWGLRNDPRVHALEGRNARYLDPEMLPYRPTLAVIDVSFISLKLVLPRVVACLAAPGSILALVKPQFEVGRGQVGAGGIVRDRNQHRAVLEDLLAFARGRGWGVADLCAAALRGAEGNQEYFLHIVPTACGAAGADLSRRVERLISEGAS